MRKIELFISLGFGAAAFGSGLIIGEMDFHSAWLPSGIMAAISFLAGCFDLMTVGFFGGVILAVLCTLMPGLFFRGLVDRYEAVIAAPILLLLVLGVTSVAFLLGKLMGSGVAAWRRPSRDRAPD